MAKPKPSAAFTAADISALRTQILQRPPWWPGDPIDMDHILQIDRGLAKQVTALRLETQSELHRVMAENAAKAAKLMR